MHRKYSGFTLVELLVSIAVAAIVLAIGVPSFQNLIQTNQLATQTNKFIGSLNYARSEAVKRKQNVVICPSSALGNCNGGNAFNNGWLVYVDADRSNNFTAGDTSLWLNAALSNSLSLNANQPRFAFNSKGRPTGTQGSVVVCVDADLNLARRIVLSPAGNIRLAKEGPNGIPEDNTGTEISSC